MPLPKSKTNFALPPPVDYSPPSVLTRYRVLVLLFIALFFGAIVLARHLIQVHRDRPLPLVPVYLEHFEEKKPQPEPPPTKAASEAVKKVRAPKKAPPAP